MSNCLTFGPTLTDFICSLLLSNHIGGALHTPQPILFTSLNQSSTAYVIGCWVQWIVVFVEECFWKRRVQTYLEKKNIHC